MFHATFKHLNSKSILKLLKLLQWNIPGECDRRLSTRGERGSARIMYRNPWWVRGALCLVTLLCLSGCDTANDSNSGDISNNVANGGCSVLFLKGFSMSYQKCKNFLGWFVVLFSAGGIAFGCGQDSRLEGHSAELVISESNAAETQSNTYTVSAGNDDCTEDSSVPWSRVGAGNMYIGRYSSSYPEMGFGAIFQNVDIPQGAQITSAYLKIYVTSGGDGQTVTTAIQGFAQDNAPNFSVALPSAKPQTQSSQGWQIPGTANTWQQSPDISAIVQEIVGLTGWVSGNRLGVVIKEAGTSSDYELRPESYEGNAARAAELFIEWEVTPPDPKVMWTQSTLDLGDLKAGESNTLAVQFTSIGSNYIIEVTENWDDCNCLSSTPQSPFSLGDGESQSIQFTALADAALTPDTTYTAAYHVFSDADPTVDELLVSFTYVVEPTGGQYDGQVSSGADDCSEDPVAGWDRVGSGTMYLGRYSSSYPAMSLGAIFSAVDVPEGATIDSARLNIYVGSGGDGQTVTADIAGFAVDDVDNFATSLPSEKDQTNTLVDWQIPGTAGVWQQSPELKNVVQEIVDLQGWQAGNRMGFVVAEAGTSGDNEIRPVSFESNSSQAARLVIDWSIEDVCDPGSFTCPGGVPCACAGDCCDGANCITVGDGSPGSPCCSTTDCSAGGSECIDSVCTGPDCLVDEDCDDGISCTDDSCNETTGSCDFIANDGSCNDWQLCNGDETCDANDGCVPGSDPCPGQLCIEDTGCVDCIEDNDCNNDDFCDGVETCLDGSCQDGTAVSCDDGVGCTDDTCNETTDSCDIIANDGNCNDGLWCNGAETCDAVLGCQAGMDVICNDGIGCTDDSCNETNDSCEFVPNDGNCDDDGLWCNGAETCSATQDCQIGSDPCPEYCDEGQDSCYECNLASDCEDYEFCNGAEICDANGDCQAGADPCPGQMCDEDNDECIAEPCYYDEDSDGDNDVMHEPGSSPAVCWRRCPMPQEWDGTQCTGTEADDYSRNSAVAACEGVGDYHLVEFSDFERILAPCNDQDCSPCASSTCNDLFPGKTWYYMTNTQDGSEYLRTYFTNGTTASRSATQDDYGALCIQNVPECYSAADCEDDEFCNGVETCDVDGNCQAGNDPCPGQACNETADQCTEGPSRKYFWNMDTDPGWTGDGSWAFGQPAGNGGSSGNPDPSSGFTGSNVYGYNLSGDYSDGMSERHLTTAAIDCTGFSDVSLKFQSWLGVEEYQYDRAYLKVSNDGSNWTTLFSNPTSNMTAGAWEVMEYDISEWADDQATVYIRWTQGTSDGSVTYCGWNIDDVEIWAIGGCEIDDDCDDELNCNGEETCSGGLCVAGINQCPAHQCDEIDGCLPYTVEDVIRIQVDWGGSSAPDTYNLGDVVFEKSGTQALHDRSWNIDPRGSFLSYVRDPFSDDIIYQAGVGIGQVYRTLDRTIAFRFPATDESFVFTMDVENADTGVFEEVIRTTIDPNIVDWTETYEVERRHLRYAVEEPHVLVTIYAEAFSSARKEHFFDRAQAVVDTFENTNLPGFSRLAFDAVFRVSNDSLGSPVNRGMPVPIPDTYLGMYYPYWSGPWDNGFSRWNMIMYPTDVTKFRTGLGQAPYDYPIILVDSSAYWGTGNYNAHTAIPSDANQFSYLLRHEFGHFIGLNEEYSTDGTELFFGYGVDEPFSQNLTFKTDREDLKWADLVDESTPLPTNASDYYTYGIGAYPGGYAGDDSRSHIPVPSGRCIMDSASDFCEVCRQAIISKIQFDSGM